MSARKNDAKRTDEGETIALLPPPSDSNDASPRSEDTDFTATQWRNVYVASLPWTMTDDELRELVEQFGPVERIFVPRLLSKRERKILRLLKSKNQDPPKHDEELDKGDDDHLNSAVPTTDEEGHDDSRTDEVMASSTGGGTVPAKHRIRGYAFVLFTTAADAKAAIAALHGSVIQGRTIQAQLARSVPTQQQDPLDSTCKEVPRATARSVNTALPATTTSVVDHRGPYHAPWVHLYHPPQPSPHFASYPGGFTIPPPPPPPPVVVTLPQPPMVVYRDGWFTGYPVVGLPPPAQHLAPQLVLAQPMLPPTGPAPLPQPPTAFQHPSLHPYSTLVYPHGPR